MAELEEALGLSFLSFPSVERWTHSSATYSYHTLMVYSRAQGTGANLCLVSVLTSFNLWFPDGIRMPVLCPNLAFE